MEEEMIDGGAGMMRELLDLAMSEIRAANPGSTVRLSDPTDAASGIEVVQANGGMGSAGGSGEEDPENTDLPPCWKVYMDGNQYAIANPIVIAGATMFNATGSISGAGSWYAHVKSSSATVTNQAERQSDELMVVPICQISDRGIEQWHLGAIIVGGGREYIAGDDTNIVFTEITEGEDAGKIAVDVYYL